MTQPLRPFGPPVPWGLRLLLLAALLLGIVTMHTLGHPTGAHGGHDRHPATQHMAGAEHRPELRSEPAPDPRLMGDGRHALGVDPASAGGMDPMAVCLAVLAGWTLVFLVGPLLRRNGDAAAEVRARLLRAVRALPPPGGGRILLTRLSVLRQ